MPLLPDDTRQFALCNELPTDCIDDHEQVLIDRCSLPTAHFQSDSMAPKKKMRRSAKKMSMTAAKKTVHFCDDNGVELVEEETGDIFSSMDYLFTNNNTDDEVDTELHVQCDSEIETEESENEVDEATTNTTGDELEQLFAVYRLEVEQLVRTSAAMGNEKRILTLERLVNDLLEHNETLVTSLAEVKAESAKRVIEMHRRLECSAARTEEVMLSLASHELLLKKFVNEHCCSCCACDLRLMQFRLCHREQCEDHEVLNDDQNGVLFLGQCRTAYQAGNRQWNSIIHNTSAWFNSGHTRRKRLLPMDNACAHNLPSQLRFTSFVDQIDHRLEVLEVENEEVKCENALLRELNSLLSGRNGPPMTISNSYRNAASDNNHLPSLYQTAERGEGSVGESTASSSSSSGISNGYVKEKLPLNHHHPHQPQHHLPRLYDEEEGEGEGVEEMTTNALSEHLITFLGECSQRNQQTSPDDYLGNYLHDSLDLRDGIFGSSSFGSSSSEHGGSRSELSLNSSHGRTDNDSGCSTDLIPSQTDMNSLMTQDSSDGEDEVEELLRSVMMEGTTTTKDRRKGEKLTTSSKNHNHHTHLNTTNSNSSTAERLVPKLYSKLLYYLVQRNMLLRQFRQENRARQKCKQELSTLADCVAAGLKDIELNTKVIKQIQLQSDTSLF